MNMTAQAKARMTSHYRQLIGWTVEFAEMAEESDTGAWPIIQLRKGDKVRVVEVSRDPEGNGPGYLFIGEEHKA